MGLAMTPPAPIENTELPITESPRDGKIALARRLGQPFSENTVATWLHQGRKYLTGCAAMERINASWDLALAAEDIAELIRLLLAAEQITAADYKGNA